MSDQFFVATCQTQSSEKLFGLCDDPSPSQNPAYIDEKDGSKWIAVVENESRNNVAFTAIDNCVEIRRPDGTMEKRCDGALTYNKNIIFVELKERSATGNNWVIDAERQLKATIGGFENTEKAQGFEKKKAYIANSLHPKFKESQSMRMERFLSDTGYVLRIVNRISID
ncbi:MAG: hypothetical protein ACMVP2_17025 [Imperialibacter sp.]|uniref:hypothetical protein n=1 Tax=Imperialibacter sp. TaxID=2038411 RepID=UPI003A897E99